jgi:hypothetical protein
MINLRYSGNCLMWLPPWLTTYRRFISLYPSLLTGGLSAAILLYLLEVYQPLSFVTYRRFISHYSSLLTGGLSAAILCYLPEVYQLLSFVTYWRFISCYPSLTVWPVDNGVLRQHFTDRHITFGPDDTTWRHLHLSTDAGYNTEHRLHILW